jgi:hypothetical protein
VSRRDRLSPRHLLTRAAHPRRSPHRPPIVLLAARAALVGRPDLVSSVFALPGSASGEECFAFSLAEVHTILWPHFASYLCPLAGLQEHVPSLAGTLVGVWPIKPGSDKMTWSRQKWMPLLASAASRAPLAAVDAQVVPSTGGASASCASAAVV